MYDVTVDFPKFKVGVAIRDGVVTSLKYLPLSSPSIASKSDLAKRAAATEAESAHAVDDAHFCAGR